MSDLTTDRARLKRALARLKEIRECRDALWSVAPSLRRIDPCAMNALDRVHSVIGDAPEAATDVLETVLAELDRGEL